MADIGKDILRAKALLDDDKLVAIPTETVYGLAANALHPEAVLKIFTAKNRPAFDPLIIHVPSVDKVLDYAESFPEKAHQLATHFWPGPLTLVLPKKEILPDLVTSGLATVGIRCPDHELTRKLLRELSYPLAAPSANPFGYVSPTTAAHVAAQLGNKIDYILDGGPCKVGIESTIVGFENNNPVIYRRGGISQEEIEKIIGPVESHLNSSSNPIAPGQLESHYAPDKKFFLGKIGSLRAVFDPAKAGILSFRGSGNVGKHELVLAPTGSLEEAAKNLFAYLRQLDQMDIEVILAEEVPDIGIGRAINDRLRRAAANRTIDKG